MKALILLNILISSAEGSIVPRSSSNPAFISPSPVRHGRKSHKALCAYTDDRLGGLSNIKISKNNNKSSSSNVIIQNLPPSILPNGGKITMVGSGPGDPDLLTIAAHKILSDPSILVISDRLVSPEILNLIKGEIKVARKLPGCADEAQNEVSLLE